MKKNLFLTAILLLTLVGSVMAQTRTITGSVTSAEDGEPLPGANVVVVGQSIGTITSADGTYSLDVPSNAQSIEFLFVGMESTEVSIGNQTVIDVALNISLVGLEEAVVTALGIERKEKAL